MSAHYNVGEVKPRPGVYRRFTNIGKFTHKSSDPTITPGEPFVPYLTLSEYGVVLYSGDAPYLDGDGVLVFSAIPSVSDGILHFKEA